MLVEALTVFLAAFLLFQIEPLIGKYLLPWFGGAPAVWSTCLLFFQSILLAGYLYAHGLAASLAARRARVFHGLLLALSLAALVWLVFRWGSPILPDASWKPRDSSDPAGRILLLLTMSIGLPYLLLASTSPLLQAWAARRFPRAKVYRLYAVSNLASLLALLTYPTLVERLLPLRAQGWSWSVAYVLFAAAALFCVWRLIEKQPLEEPVDAAAIDPHDTAPAAAASERRLHVFWFALAACGSLMLLATTNQMCQEVAAIPFLWVLPLCLYLLSFVLCFQSDRLYARGVFLPALAASLGWAAVVLLRGYVVGIRMQIAAYSTALFVSCMVCHGELARSRPRPSRLTAFYLTIAAGGAAGGIFVALLAPRIFRGFWEIHIALFLAGAVALVALVRDPDSWLHTGRAWPALVTLAAIGGLAWFQRNPEVLASGWKGFWDSFSSPMGLAAFAGGLAALLILLWLKLPWARGHAWLSASCLAGVLAVLAFLLVAEIRNFLTSAVAVSRNFYGVLTVERVHEDDPDLSRLDLRHGRIVHGFQYLSEEKSRLPTTYYTEESGIGLAVLQHPRRAAGPMRIGVVGLGVGTIAAYGRSGDTVRFYEINPNVIRLSSGARPIFTYLKDCPAKVEIVLGDARLSLEREVAAASTSSSSSVAPLDVLAVDAFSSDAIPVHLLTREAIETDLRRLAPDGILAVHISNRQLDLEPVVRAFASNLHLAMGVVDRKGDGDPIWATTWILLARPGTVLESPRFARAFVRGNAGHRVRLWTDDYSNLFDVIR